MLIAREDVTHLALIREKTEASLRDAIGDPQDVALLDAPALMNVGDSMIWEGQLAYMQRLGYRVRHISNMDSYEARRVRHALPDGGAVLLRGGGNFGDIWVGHQNYREMVARELRDYPIVQLTQSVLFRERGRAAKANDELSDHPNFRLLVRDDDSLMRTEQSLPHLDARRSFDMALGWNPARPNGPRGNRALVIARNDKEARSGLIQAAAQWRAPFPIDVTDWTQLKRPGKWDHTRASLRRNAKMVRVRRKLGPIVPALSSRTVEQHIAYLNGWNVHTAIDLFWSARAMVVDRLHAHILASLLGIPHVVLDNDHGKIGAVFNSYTHQFSTAHYATTPQKAFEKLSDLMADF